MMQELFGSIYERGVPVFRQGEPGDAMYIIQSGAVEISQLQGDHEVVLALLERGDFFGEMALLDEAARSASATAIRRTRLLPLTRASLLERVRQDPGVALHLLRAISQRIERTNRLLKQKIEGDEALRRALAVCQPALGGEPLGASRPQQEPEPRETGEKYLQRVSQAAAAIEAVGFVAGEVICTQGEPADTMYIVQEGKVEISEGSGCVLAQLSAQDFFGEVALFSGGPRTATATARSTQTVLWPIRREEFLEKVRSEPELALYVLEVMIRRLRQTLKALSAPEKAAAAVRQAVAPPLKKEGAVRVSMLSLSTCSGCSAVLLDQQEELGRLLERIEVVYCPLLMDQGEIPEADVALVDGAVRVREDAEMLEEARRKHRYLVSWGTCASFGGIPSLANSFELEELIEESYGQTEDPFTHYLSGRRGLGRTSPSGHGPALLRRAGKLDNFVRVDYYLPGCPPQAELLSELVCELRGEPSQAESRKIVCVECPRKPLKAVVESFQLFPRPEWEANQCFSSRGALCLGFLTKGGCGAKCPRGGLPCWGCRGPSDVTLGKMEEGTSFEKVVLSSLARRCRLPEDKIEPVLKMALRSANSSLNFYQNFVSDRTRLR